jgi:hemerythrin-like domain-containing protein/mannose-6-phosphate isomerase-like protein (cupin superfamily)
MKRSPALASLSRDHHEALVVARKLLRTGAPTVDQALSDLRAYWDEHGQAHFRAEEEVLLPAYARHANPYDPLLAKLVCDHLAIRQRIQALDRDSPDHVTALNELGRLLNQHVRLEERELFPMIEAALPDAELAAVASALDQATTTAAPVQPPNRDDHPDQRPPGDGHAGISERSPVNAPVELDDLHGVGPVWGIASEDLNATALSWGPGQGVAEHTNAERDVLLITIAGSGIVVIDGQEHRFHDHRAVLISKGARRRITAGANGLRYVSVHHRRGPLQIEVMGSAQ